MMRFLSFLMISVVLMLSSCLGGQEDEFTNRLNKDVATIDSYLATNGITNAIEDVSGVRYHIQTLGTGYTPRITDQVTFDYTGKLIDGTVFQSSTLTDFTISNLISGFQIGLTQIPNGSIATLYIPSGYGYGPQATGNIPGNSILVFEIKLKGIKVTSTELTKLGSDTVAIDQFLTSAAIANVVKDTTGLRYVITELGTGEKPGLFNRVKIKYTGFLFDGDGEGSQFYSGSNEPGKRTDSRVVNYIRGFQFALLNMPKGSKATLYIPSGLAFGAQAVTSGSVTVPANSNLIYDLELVDVFDVNP